MNAPANTRTVPSIFTCPACGMAIEAVQYIKSAMVIGLNCVRCDWTWTRSVAIDKAHDARANVEILGVLTPAP